MVTADAFLWFACAALVLAPMVTACDGWRLRSIQVIAATLWVVSCVALVFSWRDIAGGFRAALSGHLALICGVAMLAALGHLARRLARDTLAAALLGFVLGVLCVGTVFAMGPALGGPAIPAVWLLGANPLVTAASAAGIDILHLDAIYRTSPLAHRGIQLPSWMIACALYLLTGATVHAARHLRPWSH